MKGVVKPQQTATNRKDVMYARGVGVETSDMVRMAKFEFEFDIVSVIGMLDWGI